MSYNNPDRAEFEKDIRKHLSSSEQFCQPYWAGYHRLNSLYHAELPGVFSKPPAGRSHLVPPEFHNSVRAAKVRMKREVFALRPLVQVEPVLPLGEENAKLGQMVLDHNFKQNQIELKFGQLIFRALMQTVGLAWIEFETKYDLKLEKNKEGKYEFFKREDLPLFKGFTIKPLSIYQVYPDPLSAYLDEFWEYQGRYFGIRVMTTISALKATSLYDEDKLDQIKPQKTTFENFQKPYYPHLQPISNILSGEHHDYPVELTHFVEKGRIRTYANREVKVRDQETLLPEYQLITAYLENEDFSFFGITPAKIAEDTFYELYQKRNQRIDNINLALTDVYITDDESLPDVITLFPGKVIKTRSGPDGLQGMKKQNVTDASFVEEGVAKQDLRDTFGASDYTMGLNPSRPESATGVAVMDRRSVATTVDYVRTLEDSGLKRISKKGLMLCEINYTLDDKRRIVGDKAKDFLQLDTTSVFGNYIYTCKGSDRLENQTQAKSNALQLFALFQQDPYIDPYELRKDVLEAFEKNVEKILPLPGYKLIPIYKENYLLSQGVDIPVDPQENDIEHLKIHEELIPLMQQIKNPKPALRHIVAHRQNLANKLGQQKPSVSPFSVPGGSDTEAGELGFTNQTVGRITGGGNVMRG